MINYSSVQSAKIPPARSTQLEVHNSRTGKNVRVDLDIRSDRLQVLPLTKLVLMEHSQRSAERVSKLLPVRGWGARKMLTWKKTILLFRRAVKCPRTRADAVQLALEMLAFLEQAGGVAALSGRRLLLGVDHHAVVSTKVTLVEYAPESQSLQMLSVPSVTDVLAQDEAWRHKFGSAVFFGTCALCPASVNPLCLHLVQIGATLKVVCISCRAACPPASRLRCTRRRRLRGVVWLQAFGARAEGYCHGGCGDTLSFVGAWEQGHIFAHKYGGDRSATNLRPICSSCNLRQSSVHMAQFSRATFGKELMGGVLDSASAEMLYDCLIRGHDPRELARALTVQTLNL